MFRVKPLRLDNFRAVLDDIGDAPLDGPIRPVTLKQRTAAESSPIVERLVALLDGMASSAKAYAPASRLNQLYTETRAGFTEPPAADPSAIKRELGLHSRLSPAELRRIRRAFALRNHPDRLPEPLRELATRRMTIANELIDAALKPHRP